MQIEVTFDIDANGIVNVSARDRGTGREQQIVIQSSGGLSKAQIEQMVRDAEQHAEEDRKRRDAIEAVNHAESIIHDTEKHLDDYKNDVDADGAKQLRESIAKLREALKEGEPDSEVLRQKTGELQKESLSVFKVAYEKVRLASVGVGVQEKRRRMNSVCTCVRVCVCVCAARGCQQHQQQQQRGRWQAAKVAGSNYVCQFISFYHFCKHAWSTL